MADLQKKDLKPFVVTFNQEKYVCEIAVRQIEGKIYLAIAGPQGLGTAIEISEKDMFKLKTTLDF